MLGAIAGDIIGSRFEGHRSRAVRARHLRVASAMLGGNALKLAADAVFEKGKTVASFVLEASPSDITFENGRFQVAGTDRGVSLVEVAQTAPRLQRGCGRRSARWRPVLARVALVREVLRTTGRVGQA